MSSYGNFMFHSVDGGVVIHEPRTEFVSGCNFENTDAPCNDFSQNYLILFLILYLLNPPETAANQSEKLSSETAKTENT